MIAAGRSHEELDSPKVWITPFNDVGDTSKLVTVSDSYSPVKSRVVLSQYEDVEDVNKLSHNELIGLLTAVQKKAKRPVTAVDGRKPLESVLLHQLHNMYAPVTSPEDKKEDKVENRMGEKLERKVAWISSSDKPAFQYCPTSSYPSSAATENADKYFSDRKLCSHSKDLKICMSLLEAVKKSNQCFHDTNKFVNKAINKDLRRISLYPVSKVEVQSNEDRIKRAAKQRMACYSAPVKYRRSRSSRNVESDKMKDFVLRPVLAFAAQEHHFDDSCTFEDTGMIENDLYPLARLSNQEHKVSQQKGEKGKSQNVDDASSSWNPGKSSANNDTYREQSDAENDTLYRGQETILVPNRHDEIEASDPDGSFENHSNNTIAAYERNLLSSVKNVNSCEVNSCEGLEHSSQESLTLCDQNIAVKESQMSEIPFDHGKVDFLPRESLIVKEFSDNDVASLPEENFVYRAELNLNSYENNLIHSDLNIKNESPIFLGIPGQAKTSRVVSSKSSREHSKDKEVSSSSKKSTSAKRVKSARNRTKEKHLVSIVSTPSSQVASSSANRPNSSVKRRTHSSQSNGIRTPNSSNLPSPGLNASSSKPRNLRTKTPGSSSRSASGFTKKERSQLKERRKDHERLRQLQVQEEEHRRKSAELFETEKLLLQATQQMEGNREEMLQKEAECQQAIEEKKRLIHEERKRKRVEEAEKRRVEVERRREEKRKADLALAEKNEELQRLSKLEKEKAEILKAEMQRHEKERREKEEKEKRIQEQRELERKKEEERLIAEVATREQMELKKLQEERLMREKLLDNAELKLRMLRNEKEKQDELRKQELRRIEEERKKLRQREETRLLEEERRIKDEVARQEEELRNAMVELENKRSMALKRREENLDKRKEMTSAKRSQLVTRPRAFSYFVQVPRQIWELPIGWQKRPTYRAGGIKVKKT